MTSLLVRALRDLRDGGRPAAIPDAPGISAPNSPLVFAVGALAEIVSNLLTQMSAQQGHWRVAYRRLQGEGVIGALQWPPAPWAILPDDGRRYYADPFVIARDGRTHLFVEEFPYATRKGLISHAVLDPDGAVSRPMPVLEAAGHLSYPFVFEHGGQVYMIPKLLGAPDRALPGRALPR